MEENTGTSPATTDYKAELDRARAELANKKELERELAQAKFTLKKKNIEEKKSKVFDSQEDDTTEEKTPDVAELVKAQVKEALASTQAESYLSKHTLDPDEIELAKFHLENTIRPSGNPEVDALAALSVANQSKILKQNSELKTAIVNRNQVGATSQASGGEKTVSNDFGKSLTNEQVAELRSKHGFTDAQIKLFLQKRGSRTN